LVPEALAIVRDMQIKPSSPFHSRIVQTAPQVVRVVFEPNTSPTANTGFTQRLVIVGSAKFAPDQLSWAAANPGSLTQPLAQGGRLQISIHCGHLQDANSRVFSGSVDAVTGFDSGVRPSGGTFESWFFVRLG
jgi:hypothetical protein